MPRLRPSDSSVYNASPAPGPSRGTPSSNVQGGTAASPQTIPLPTYQPPEHPLTPAAHDKISMLLNSYPSNKLRTQLKNASDNLTNHVDEINQLAREGKEAHQRRSAKRARETSSAHDDNDDEADLHRLQEKVKGMTDRMETSVRKCIDADAKVEAVSKSLREIQGNAQRSATQATQATAAVTQDGEENEEESSQRPQALKPAFDEGLEKHTDLYLVKRPKLRYKEHDWFRNFKQTAYYAIHGDEAKRPDPDTWFEDEGEPRPGETGGTDDDFEEVGERISTTCPLTLKDFVEPARSKKCPHSYEKEEIIKFIRAVRPPTGRRDRDWVQSLECPVPGCGSRLMLDDLEDDIRLKALMRRKKRQQELARQQAEEDEEEYRRETRDGTRVEEIESDDENDIDNVEARSRAQSSAPATVKRERVRRATQDVIEDDDDDD